MIAQIRQQMPQLSRQAQIQSVNWLLACFHFVETEHSETAADSAPFGAGSLNQLLLANYQAVDRSEMRSSPISSI